MRVFAVELTPTRLLCLLTAAALLGFYIRPVASPTSAAFGTNTIQPTASLGVALRGGVPPGQTPKNLVLTMAGGPNYEGSDGRAWASRFGGSFRRANEDADVVFFTTGVHATVASVAEALQLTPQLFSTSVTDELWSKMEVAAQRWHLFRVFLETHAADYSHGWVLAIDARDSFFQRDPFRLAEEISRAADITGPCASVVAFLEQGVTIGGSQWNTDVIAACYPPEVLVYDGPVARAPVSCSGTLLASYAGMLEYLRAMEEEMLAPLAVSPRCQAAGGRDQGFHNVLIHSGRLAARLAAAGLGGLRIYANEDGPVQTLQFGDLRIDSLGRVLNAKGSVAHIVHQFDRKHEVVKLVEAMFPVMEVRGNLILARDSSGTQLQRLPLLPEFQPVQMTTFDGQLMKWAEERAKRSARVPHSSERVRGHSAAPAHNV